MNVFVTFLKAGQKQKLSSSKLEAARGLTSLIVSNKEFAVYRGTETDDPVLQPVGIVNKLKKKKLLPHDCFIERVTFPGSSMKRSALFGVGFMDLTLRYDLIRDYIDENSTKFPLEGGQCLKLLGHMVAHAYVYEPGLIKEDAAIQSLSSACKDPVLFKALKLGAAGPIVELLQIAAKAD